MDEASTRKLIELLETMADKLKDHGETLVILAQIVPLVTQLSDHVKGQQEIILSLQRQVNLLGETLNRILR